MDMKRYKITLTEDEVNGCRDALLNQAKLIKESSERFETEMDGAAYARCINILNSINLQKDDSRNEC